MKKLLALRLLGTLIMTALIMFLVGLGWLAYQSGLSFYFILSLVLVGTWAYLDPQRLAESRTQE